MGCTMIQVTRLTKYFGPVMAVNDVSFNVEKNEIVGLLGNCERLQIPPFGAVEVTAVPSYRA